jgi:DNA topoisomerase-3
VQPGEQPRTDHADVKGLKTKPPARYSEATLLGAMEGAGKQIDDDELREAMQEKGLGTPATRAIIEGLLTEKYMLREGRELIPTAKAFQLMTLLRGLEVEELCRADLTGEWEFKLSQMEKGQLSREAFMQQIQAMTEKLVKKAKEYDRDTIPGDYATLPRPAPTAAAWSRELPPLCLHGRQWRQRRLRLLVKSPAGRTFETAEAEQLLRDAASARWKASAPRPAGRSWPRSPSCVTRKTATSSWNSTSATTRTPRTRARSWTLPTSKAWAPAPSAARPSSSMAPTMSAPRPCPRWPRPRPAATSRAADHLQQPIEREQMSKLLQTGKTDLLEKFVSNRTRRNFKAFLVWDGAAGKVNFEFEQREGKYPARKTAGAAAAKTTTAAAKKTGTAAKKTAAKTATKATTKTAAVKKPRTVSATLKPSADLAAVIGSEPTSRPDVIKKLWDYIKANGLQDAKDKRAINADAKLKPVFGKEQISMFELAGIVGKHVS